MKLSFVEKLDVNKIILNVLIVLFAYSISGAVFKILSEGTLGSIFRHLLFTTPYLLLIIIFSMYDVGRFSFTSLVPTIPSNFNLILILKRYSWLLLLAIIIGWLSANNLVHLGLLYVPVILFVIGSLIVSCYWMFNEKELPGIMLFLLVMPFFEFININHWEIGIKKIEIGQVLYNTYEFPLSAVFLLIIAGCYFLGNYNKINAITKREENFVWLCLIFVFSPIFSILLSMQPVFSFFYYLFAIMLPFIYFFILMKSIKTYEDISKILFILVMSGAILIFFALYWRYKSGGIINITTGVRDMSGGHSAFFLNPVVIPLLLPLQMGLYKILKGWKKSIIAFSIVFNFLYLILINHRASQVGVLVGLLVLMFFWRKSFIKKLYFTTVFMVLAVSLVIFFSDYIFEKSQFFRIMKTYEAIALGTSWDIISTNRISIWKGSLNLLSDYPFFGIGPGMYLDYMPEYSTTKYFRKDIFENLVRYYVSGPHNLYLEVWLYYGLITFISYMLILYIVVKRGIWNINNSSNQLSRTLSLSIYVCLTIWLVMSFFTLEFFQFQSLVPFVFWTIIAVILKLNVFNSAPNGTEEYSPI